MTIRKTAFLPAIAAALSLAAAPALAARPAQHAAHPPHPVHPAHPASPAHPGPAASPAAKARAYGRYCQGQSKTHVAGTPGTPFSACVTDMAKLAHHHPTSPAKACADESRRHVAGTPGTPYSKCVSGARRLQKAMAEAHAASAPRAAALAG